jgi:hypothetical protein
MSSLKKNLLKSVLEFYCLEFRSVFITEVSYEEFHKILPAEEIYKNVVWASKQIVH